MNRLKPLARRLTRYLDTLPVVLPVAAAAFGLVAMVLLLLGQLHSMVVFPLGGLAAGIAGFVAGKAVIKDAKGQGREWYLCGLAVLLLVVLWTIFNVRLVSQHVFVTRDPALYSVAGGWLRQHNELDLETPSMFKDVEGVRGDSAGFGPSKTEKDRIVPQGQRLMPVFVGLWGRLAGEARMFYITPLLGGLALLAVFGFARLLGRPRWALFITACLGLALPMVYFSRNTYSEPLALLLTFGSLSLLWLAQRQRSLPLWGLAGMTAGATVLARIDGFITVIACTGFLAIWLALAAKKDRTQALKESAVFLIAAVAVYVIGWLDLTVLGNNYNRSLRLKLLQAFFALLVLGSVVVLVSWRTTLVKWLDKTTKRWRAPVMAIALALLIVGLASRPFWQVSHHSKHISLVAGLQLQEGQPIDDARDYAEQTMTWIAWYLGPMAALLGAAGFVIIGYRIVKNKTYLQYLPFFLVFFCTALIFLIRPSITPDQLWASRRLLPVIFPAVAVCAVVALDRLWGWRPKGMPRAGQIGASVAAVLMLLGPLFLTRPFVNAQTAAGQLGLLKSFCAQLPQDAAVLWVGQGGFSAVQATRTFCGVPAARLPAYDKQAVYKAGIQAKAEGKQLVLGVVERGGVAEQDAEVPNARLAGELQYATVPSTLRRPPRATIQNGLQLFIAPQVFGVPTRQ